MPPRASNSSFSDAADGRPPARLRFNQALSWKAGKSIAVGDLLKRLQTLANELKEMDQEEVPRDALQGPAAELVNKGLLEHKDKGVKAWTACCLVDVLRVCAPDAPYTTLQLKDIFALLIDSIIPSLADPSSPYNSQHLYVLNSLSHVKSIVLLTDVPAANGLILNLFRTCFDVLSTAREDLSKNVEYFMTGVLNCMIDECASLPPEVIEIILAQFFHADPNARSNLMKQKKGANSANTDEGQSKIQRQVPTSYHLAKNICNTAAERMSRYVSQYFSGVIMDSSFMGQTKPTKSRRRARASSDDSDDDGAGQQGPSEDDMKQLERAHRLLRELWRSCPDVLQNVIPQVETETSAENVQLRLLATQTLGDMAAGVGIAGDNSTCTLAPAAFPPEMLVDDENSTRARTAPQSFSHTQVGPYQQFLSRRNDKSAHIRAAWTTCVGRILSTSAGGVGLEESAETELAKHLSHMLVDQDEKVRLAAIAAVSLFSLKEFVEKLGPLGGVDEPDSILHNLADRTKDRKAPVRSEAIQLLGKLWGAASGEIAAGNLRVKILFGSLPSTICNAFYINDRETHCFIDKALFESLIPFGYPAVKKKEKNQSPSKTAESGAVDADQIRTERILLMLNGLDEKARTVFFALMGRSKKQGPYVDAFLKCCEAYNGGVAENDSKENEKRLGKLNDHISAWAMDPIRAKDDLNTFAKMHDRRSYALIRFCMGADGDYSKVYKSLRELERRMSGFPPQNAAVFETLKPLILRVANVFENRSHIRPIVDIARSNEKSLANAAIDFLKHITTTNPTVFKTHAGDLFRTIESNAPTSSRPNDETVLDSLKACSSFAKRFPSDVPKDRKFLQAMIQYAQYGSPPATAKHAVSILMHATDKKQMHAKDLLRKSVDDFEFEGPHFLTKLTCLSQLMLLAADELEDDLDAMTDIAINQVLNKAVDVTEDSQAEWAEEPDEICQAKLHALKILVNRLRSYDDPAAIAKIYPQVYRMLDILVSQRGELSKRVSTPESHKSRLYLQAATLYLKLSSKRGFDRLLTPAAFNTLALTAQTDIFQVRHGFIQKIKKLLAQDLLPVRFYCPLFLLPFDKPRIKDETMIWLRTRAATLSANAARSSTTSERGPIIELLFARLLSLLAHHPDFTTSTEDLTSFTQYILYYLRSVATASNISLIYAVAQKTKAVQDLLASTTSYDGDLDASTNLYVLSDLAQATIRAFEEEKGWSLQAESAHVSLPSSIFKAMPSAAVAQETARKNFLPEDFAEEVAGIVKAGVKGKAAAGGKKRKSDATAADDGHASKRRNVGNGGARQPKTPSKGRKKGRSRSFGSDDDEDEDDVENSDEDGSNRGAKATVRNTQAKANGKGRRREASENIPSSERRKSSRAAGGTAGKGGKRKSYADTRDSSDDEAMREWNEDAEEDIEEDQEENDGTQESSHENDEIEIEIERDAIQPQHTTKTTNVNESSISRDSDFEEPQQEEETTDLAASTSSKENTTTRSPNDPSRTRARSAKKPISTSTSTSTKAKQPSSKGAKVADKARTLVVSRQKGGAEARTEGGSITLGGSEGGGRVRKGKAVVTKVVLKRNTRNTRAANGGMGDEFDIPGDDDE